MKTLPFAAGVFLLLLVLSTNTHAQTDLIFDCPDDEEELTLDDNQNFTENWLDGKVCFKGKKRIARQQYLYAKAHDLEFSLNSVQFWGMVNGKILVPLKSTPHEAPLRAVFDTPFVLPATAEFTRNLALAHHEAKCGRLYVTGGGRFRVFRNSSEYSVHPAGMAVDIRIRDLSRRCYNNLSRLLYNAEAERVADTTRERWPPHFHVVVVQKPKIIAAKGDEEAEISDQGE